MKKKRKTSSVKFQIDQSGKIEQTNKDTVLCLAEDSEEGFWDGLVIKSKTKRQLQKIFRRNGQPKNYVLFVFCAGLYLLIKRNLHIPMITIDREYFGKEAIIKEILLQMLEGSKIIPEIEFGNIGRKVQAHLKGYRIYTGKLVTKKNSDTIGAFSGNKKDRGRKPTEECLSDE